MRNFLLNLLLARLTAGETNKGKVKTPSPKGDFKNLLLEHLKGGKKSSLSKGGNKFPLVVLIKDQIPQRVIKKAKIPLKVEEVRNSKGSKTFKNLLSPNNFKSHKTIFGKNLRKGEIPLKEYLLIFPKEGDKKNKNLEILKAKLSNWRSPKLKTHHLMVRKIGKNIKGNRLNIEDNLKVEKKVDNILFPIEVNYLPMSSQGGKVLGNKAINLYGTFNNPNLQRFIVKDNAPKRDKSISTQSLSGELKGFIPLTESKVKATETLRGVKRVDYRTPMRSFQIKIPLEENLVLKIRVVRDNFYAKISGESQTVNLLIQNLQTVAQQVANLGFSKAVIGIYTSGGSGKGFNGRQSSEDGNNKHKNAEKVAKTSDTNPNRNFNFRTLL